MNNLYKKILKLQLEIGSTPKNGFNKFGNYKYWLLSDIFNKFKLLCKELNIVITHEDILTTDRKINYLDTKEVEITYFKRYTIIDLVANGANINHVSINGNTALILAIKSNYLEIAENDILRAVYRNPENPNGFNQQIFTLNQLRYGYFQLPVEIRWEQDEQTHSDTSLSLLFRTDNLYMEGFTFTHHQSGSHLPDIFNYYYFNFALQIPRYRNQYGRGNFPRIEHLENVEGFTSIRLEHIAPDYRDMITEQGEHITWNNIFGSFLQLTSGNIDINTELPLGNLARSLRDVILVTAEAMRFRNVFSVINNILVNGDDHQFVNLALNPNEHSWDSEDSYGLRGARNNIYNILVNWGSLSQPTGNINRVDQNVRWLLENYHNWATNIGVANMFSYVIDLLHNLAIKNLFFKI